MGAIHPYIALLAMLGAALLVAAIFWLYNAVTHLCQDFMYFSRRFRGVE